MTVFFFKNHCRILLSYEKASLALDVVYTSKSLRIKYAESRLMRSLFFSHEYLYTTFFCTTSQAFKASQSQAKDLTLLPICQKIKKNMGKNRNALRLIEAV